MDGNGNKARVNPSQCEPALDPHDDAFYRPSAYYRPPTQLRKMDAIPPAPPIPAAKTEDVVFPDRPKGPPAGVAPSRNIEAETVAEEEVVDDQCMRISAPASRLKDVRKVKRDLYHDKKQSGNLLRSLSRSLSISRNGGLGPIGSPQPENKEGGNPVSQVGRRMSLPKEGVMSSDMTDEAEDRPRGGGARASPAAKQPVRKGIASVGRMLSKSRQKGGAANASPKAEPEPASDEPLPERGGARASPANRSSGARSARAGGGMRAGVRAIGRSMSMKRSKDPKKSPTAVARKVSDGTEGAAPGAEAQRSGEGTTPGSGARPALGQLGRSLSKMRIKNAAAQVASPVSTSTISPGTDSGMDPFSPGSMASNSASTVPSATSSVGDGERGRSKGSSSGLAAASQANASKKEATRKALKATGRALSFSRKKPEQAAEADAWSAAHTASGAGTSLSRKDAGSGEGASAEAEAPEEKPCSNFFYSEIYSKKIQDCGLLGEDNEFIRVPVIMLEEYSGPVSRMRWFVDAFTLPHNAVRKECMDLYDILIAIARQCEPADVAAEDMANFHAWWRVAHEFLTRYFDLEKNIIFPWVDEAGADHPEVELALNKMRALKEKLKSQVDAIDAVFGGIATRSPAETYVMVYQAVDLVIPRLMKYFKDQEILLPAIVKGWYKIEDRLKMDKDMVAALGGGGGRDECKHYIVLLARWMSNPRQQRAWLSKNLDSRGRRQFSRWNSAFEKEHYKIVTHFRKRVVVKKSYAE